MQERPSVTERLKTVRFSDEQRGLLEKAGYLVLELRGESIASLKSQGEVFWSNWHRGLPMEYFRSRFSEVAIGREDPFLQESRSLSVFKQLLLVNEYSRAVSKEIPGVHAVMGSAIDYLDLNRCYKKTNGGSLFRNAGSFDNAASTTLTADSHAVYVGESYTGSLVVSYRFGKNGYDDIKAMPLIVPIKIK